MKQKITIFLFLLTSFFACEDKPAYEKKGWTEKQLHPETIGLSKAQVNGKPLMMSKEVLIKEKGKPLVITKKCRTTSIMPKQARVNLDGWRYDTTKSVYNIRNIQNLEYQVVNDSVYLDDKAYIRHLNFEVTGFEIKTPEITLSKHTTIKEIKQKFPNSYAHRNLFFSFTNRKDGYTCIHLYDDLPKERRFAPNVVELGFKGESFN